MNGPGNIRIIGELINHAFARARRAWQDRDIAAYQNLARTQTEEGAHYLTVNLGGTQTLPIQPEQMLEFLPELVPALQEATPLPLAFDSPNLKYHQRALQHYDFRRSPAPMVNSLAVSREDLDGFYEIIGHYKTDVIVMAAEGMGEDGRPRPNFEPDEVLAISLRFVEKLRSLGIDNDKIFIDPGLFPVTGDTSGRVSMSLEAIRKIRASSDLQGVHTCVGLTNFSLGAPKEVRHLLECAYLTMAHPLGLDAILASPEKDWRLLSQDDPVLLKLKEALAFRAGTPRQKRPT